MRVLQASQIGGRADPPLEPCVLFAPHGLGGNGVACDTVGCAAKGPSGLRNRVTHDGLTSARLMPSLSFCSIYCDTLSRRDHTPDSPFAQAGLLENRCIKRVFSLSGF